MKFRVALQLPGGGTHDVTLTCDVTATVADLARTLIRAGLGADPLLTRVAAERLRPVTLRGHSAPNATPVLLDPGLSVVDSGLLSGWTIEPVAEFEHAGAQRLVEPAGYVEVLSGQQAGALYSLLPGQNLLGRDVSSRVFLGDKSVSRRHAQLTIATSARTVTAVRAFASGNAVAPGFAQLRDLGSANGTRVRSDTTGPNALALESAAPDVSTVDVTGLEALTIDGPTEFELGGVAMRFTPGPPASEGPRSVSGPQTLHMRSPRVDPKYEARTQKLPAPPAPVAPGRIPLLAMLAPVIMGGVLFAVTRSPMSLMMMAFSPVMMIGSWIDGRFGAGRKLRREGQSFRAALAVEREQLEQLHSREVEVRGREAPTLDEVDAAICERTGLLWARRPEHDAFLEVRFGEGALPSRTQLTLPERGDSDAAQWEEVRTLEREFACANPVPVTERLDQCGAIGVTGDPLFTAGLARSLVLQLAGLHSPEELVLACFAAGASADEWEWLKWLPHVDTVTSPVPAWQLADDEASTTRLLIALEGIMGERDRRQLPVVVVLVLTTEHAAPARLIALAEEGPAVGVYVIWVAGVQTQLPAACRTFVRVGQTRSEVGFVRTGEHVPLTRVEHVETPVALRLARALAPVEDAAARSLDDSDLPRAVHLRELHPVDLTAGASPIMQAWSETLVTRWVPGTVREPASLAAPVGLGPDGPATIDLRSHGPHALVGGTTGAGKSEFLQSWIMSLAAQVSPDRLTFLLVDYKGGAAFAECVDLPHTVGLVTDLSPHLVRRALTSLRAELRYREELLAEHGAKDLMAMEQRSDPAAPPTLVIVVDEFAALATDVPEFVDGVVDVAQRGRSLGLHLILATQRPAGVIKDNLRANTNLRVALRMADETDSSDVIGVKDAAFFDVEAPGRGVIKVGPGRITHFQTGYLGGRPAQQAPAPAFELRSLAFSEGQPWLLAVDPTTARPTGLRQDKPLRDIERLRDAIVEAATLAGTRPPRRPWLDVLPDKLSLEALAGLDVLGEPNSRGVLDVTSELAAREAAAVGLRDLPDQQSQQPVLIDLEKAANIAIFGASGAGKTSSLLTLTAALSQHGREHPVEFFAIDAGGGALDAIRSLPTVSTVAQLADRELTSRILERVLVRLTERAARFAAVRCSGLAAYRAAHEGSHEPRIVLLIDGFAVLRQTAEAPGGPITQLQQITEIMATGRAAGVHVVVTADRPAAVPAALAASVQQQFVLRLASQHDYAHFGVPADVLEAAPPGRAVLASAMTRSRNGARAHVTELQFALVGGEPSLRSQARAVKALGVRLRVAGAPTAIEVRNAPDRVPLSHLPFEEQGRPVYGINVELGGGAGVRAATERSAPDPARAVRELGGEPAASGFVPVGLPASGLGVIAGPSGSGLSTAAASCAAAYTRSANARGEAVKCILLTFASDGLRLGSRVSRGGARSGDGPAVSTAGTQWSEVAVGAAEVAELARELTIAFGGKPPRAAGLGGTAVGLGGTLTALGQSDTDSNPNLAQNQRESHDGGRAAPPNAARTVVVVERPAEAEGTTALAELVALAKAARRAEALVLFEFEQGTGAAIWDLFAALKQPTWGLSLQPDEGESQSPFREHLGRVKRSSFVPGRGFAIESGRVTPIHVAHT